MAFPQVAGTAKSSDGSSVTDSVISMPASVASGDLLLAFIATDSAAGANTWDTAGGWVVLVDEAGTGFQFSVAYKIAAGGETSTTVTHAAERGCYLSARITGWHGTTPPEIATAATGDSTTPDPPDFNPAGWGTEDTLWFALFGADQSTDPLPVTTWPTNYGSNQTENHDVTTSAAVLAFATRELNAASENPGTFTMTLQETWNAYTLAVRPAAGGDTALAGSSAGVATAVSTLTTAIRFAGSSAGVATAVAILTTSIALAGSSAGIGAASAALTTAIPLAGSSSGVATASADLTTAITLVGSSAGVGAASGSIAADTALAGSSGGVSTASADLTTAIALAGSSAGAGTASADLTTQIALVGGSAGFGSASGTIAADTALAGSAAGSSTASGSLGVDSLLFGTAGGRSSGRGFMPTVPSRAEYAIELFASDGSFGPGTRLAEVWDARNIGWSTYDRLPGKAFFTQAQTSALLDLLDPLLTHVKIWRITPGSVSNVYSGVVVDYNSVGDDLIASCFDYKALLAVSRAGFKTLYPSKLIGTEIASPEWTAAKTATSSPLAFVTTGVIEDPLGTDDLTPITSSPGFGTLDQQRLQLMFDLSEIGRANTTHHTTFDISRTAPHTFSFYKDKGTTKDVAFVLNGNVSDYNYLPNWLSYRNDVATIGMDAAGGPAEIVKADAGAAAARGLRQDVFPIQTLLGISGAATEADQQQAVTARALLKGLQLQPALQLNLLNGAHDPLAGYDVNDKVRVEIGNGKESFSTLWRVLGVTCLVTEPGERLGIIVQPVVV